MKRSNGTQRVTLQDIARQTGYSVNTVSHALRNKDDIARETRERIQQAAREMGYMGNQIASSLRSGRTRTIAVILGNMSNPFYGIMADTIQDAATMRDYSLLFMCSRDRPDLEEQMVEAAVARRVDGILLFPTNESLRTVERLKSMGIPFVLMSRALGEGIADSVVCDESQGAYLAVNHLIVNGRRNLAYLSSTATKSAWRASTAPATRPVSPTRIDTPTFTSTRPEMSRPRWIGMLPSPTGCCAGAMTG